MRWNKPLTSIGPLLVITLVGVACGNASTPPPEAASEAPPEPAAAPAATDAPSDAPVDSAAEPALEDSAPAAPEGDAEAAASTGGSAISDGETRTMKVIQQTVLDNRARFRTCYDVVQEKEPEIQGDITIYFVLGSQGRVQEATLNEQRSTLKHPEVAKCIITELRKVQFPASSKGLETKVNYPFNFNPK
jgi:hypothetical protein